MNTKNHHIKFTFSSDNILYEINDAIEKEKKLIGEYRDKRFNVLNISKGGELGGNNLKWTEELLKKEALKYKSRYEFLKNGKGAYIASKRRGILDDVCSHMI